MSIRTAAIVGLVSATMAACAPAAPVRPANPPALSESSSLPPTPESDAPTPFDAASYRVERVASGLFVPWSIAWTSPERVLLTERDGRVRVIGNGILQEEPLHMFPGTPSDPEGGLMGLAVDPAYASNRFLYFSRMYHAGGKTVLDVLRFRDAGDRLEEETVLLQISPVARLHVGSRLRFGPDGKLYVTTGDFRERAKSQDPRSLAGKILRMNTDGSVPADNPFPGSLTWSYGHRNPQGIDWHPGTGVMFSTEHGPSGFDGPGGGDELNVIAKAGNHGWPEVSHERHRDGMESPLFLFPDSPAEAPASASFYAGTALPAFAGNLFVGALKGEGLWRFVLSDAPEPRIVLSEKLFDGEYGRIRDVAPGPDGALYFTTSNRDGRGDPEEGDDAVYRIVPSS